jgi:hypothetical protein
MIGIDTERVNYAFFFSRSADVPSGCREWQGPTDGRGYGTMHVGGHRVRAHRVAWTIVNGPIPEGMFVCHRCDNPKCVRDDHLFIGTQADNMRDCARKGRARHPGRPSRAEREQEAVRAYLEAKAAPEPTSRNCGP